MNWNDIWTIKSALTDFEFPENLLFANKVEIPWHCTLLESMHKFIKVVCYNFVQIWLFAYAQTCYDEQIQPLRVFLAPQMQVTNQQDL